MKNIEEMKRQKVHKSLSDTLTMFNIKLVNPVQNLLNMRKAIMWTVLQGFSSGTVDTRRSFQGLKKQQELNYHCVESTRAHTLSDQS